MNTDDTIVAISTPAGRGGIGVVRLSGPDALLIARQVLRSPGTAERRTESSKSTSEAAPTASGSDGKRPLDLQSWRVRFAELPDEQGQVMDRALVTYFQKPHSYTGEDVVEISCHGSPVVLEFLVGRCLWAGARLAEPGEFTLRAFLNGRMDLTQAEAVRDLIEAQTLYQAKVAAQQMEGAVAHRIAPLKQQLVDLIALLEADIDFAEDDVAVLPTQDIAARLAPVEEGLAQLADSFRTGKIIQQGLTLAILGRPNVGKSSLFNCLLEQDRAIVTATPGTTRDLVSETVELAGVPLRFVDTAGIRQAFDEAEAIGVRKSYEAAADSDLALLVLDGADELTHEDRDLLARLSPLGKLLVVVNKCDLPLRLEREQWIEQVRNLASREGNQLESDTAIPILFVSALQRTGIEELRRAILETAVPALAGERESQFLTNVRQERLLRESLDAFAAARRSLADAVPHEMLLLDLYNALRPLDSITGETTIEDILTHIFSTFCIGK
ncbi:MAG: tRNA uridine-5-carboxymethylaminomethyl(34) synthesis GTPase MnmE [Acidobacteria bacterium RIFCSPLOWO2_02_FULL_61_28]|nr:MAG: tRNA uridine-5-carboxymethylaminomethyl(34) synthesis GTPase MnmE [Acidobacteria bacterium RIFCSPLOWO2_02_FULL_61_28]